MIPTTTKSNPNQITNLFKIFSKIHSLFSFSLLSPHTYGQLNQFITPFYPYFLAFTVSLILSSLVFYYSVLPWLKRRYYQSRSSHMADSPSNMACKSASASASIHHPRNEYEKTKITEKEQVLNMENYHNGHGLVLDKDLEAQ